MNEIFLIAFLYYSLELVAFIGFVWNLFKKEYFLSTSAALFYIIIED